MADDARFPTVTLAEAQARVHNVGRYDRELNRLELPPNGDDYNAIMDMMNGGPARLPKKEGR